MRKVLLAVSLLILAYFANSQVLREDAIKIKNDMPGQFAIIEQFAEETWEGDKIMVVDEINAQCEAYFLLANLMKKHQGNSHAGKLLIDGIIVNSHEGWKEHNKKMIDSEKIKNLHVDWAGIYIYVDYELSKN